MEREFERPKAETVQRGKSGRHTVQRRTGINKSLGGDIKFREKAREIIRGDVRRNHWKKSRISLGKIKIIRKRRKF